MITRLLALDTYLNGSGDVPPPAPSGGGGGLVVPPSTGVFASEDPSALAGVLSLIHISEPTRPY